MMPPPRSRTGSRTIVVAALFLVVACQTTVPTAAPSAPATSAPVAANATPAASLPGPVQTSGATGPAIPSSGDLIDAAEQKGTIDHDTALLYHLYDALDYASLPAAYRSDNPETPEATTTLTELYVRAGELSPDIEANVRPFFLRPTDPKSFWQQRQIKTAGAPGSIEQAAFQDDLELGFIDAKSTPVRIWYFTALGASEQATAQKLADEIDGSDMWAKESTAMGGLEPCTDAKSPVNGGDGRLDVYLTYPVTGLNWGGRTETLGSNAQGGPNNGVTIPEGPGQSGCPVAPYILMNGGLDFDHLRSSTAHEMFHAFQFRLNSSLNPSNSWWMEATATWAKDLVYPYQNYEQSYLQGYWSMANGAEGPLDNTAGTAEYAAYLLPFYLVQKSGDKSGTVIGQIWQAIGEGRAIDVIGQRQHWADSFKEFALWNWNRDSAVKYLDAGAPIPTSALSQKAPCMDSHYVEGQGDCLLKVGTTTTVYVDLGPTKVQYYSDSPDQPLVQKVQFDLSDLKDTPGVAIQAILTLGNQGETTVEDWTGKSKRDFCLDVEDLRKIVLVVSNSTIPTGTDSGDTKASATGKIKVQALGTGCSGWIGTIHAVTKGGLTEHTAKWTETLDTQVTFIPNPEFPTFSNVEFVSDEGSVSWTWDWTDADCHLTDAGTYDLAPFVDGPGHSPDGMLDFLDPWPPDPNATPGALRFAGDQFQANGNHTQSGGEQTCANGTSIGPNWGVWWQVDNEAGAKVAADGKTMEGSYSYADNGGDFTYSWSWSLHYATP